MSETKKCKRHGCHQVYSEHDNSEDACLHHPGWPIFRDLSKKWTCCGAEKFDWDEFMKLPGCTRGKHTDVKPVKPQVKEEAREPVSSTPVLLSSSAPQPIPQKLETSRETTQESVSPPEVKKEKPFFTASGKMKCKHVGCMKEFDPEENGEEACRWNRGRGVGTCVAGERHWKRFHPGKPIFHDLKKMWSCCEAKSYDWDDFMKLPTCQVGRHQPKMVKAD